MGTKVYIAGPMRGKPGFNYDAFFEAEEKLNAAGFDTFNPARIDIHQTGFDPRRDLPKDYSDWNKVPAEIDIDSIIKRDLDLVMAADMLCMLNGWEDSTGAQAEFKVARWRQTPAAPLAGCLFGVVPSETPGFPLLSADADPMDGFTGLDVDVDYEGTADQIDREHKKIDAAIDRWVERVSQKDRIWRDRIPGTMTSVQPGLGWYKFRQDDQVFPEGDKERLDYPVFEGLLDYFPHACAEVAKHSKIGNDQHNPGEPMHWATEKSIGRGNKIVRHLMDGWRTAQAKSREKTIRHFAAMCWRANELLERYIMRMPPFEEDQ